MSWLGLGTRILILLSTGTQIILFLTVSHAKEGKIPYTLCCCLSWDILWETDGTRGESEAGKANSLRPKKKKKQVASEWDYRGLFWDEIRLSFSLNVCREGEVQRAWKRSCMLYHVSVMLCDVSSVCLQGASSLPEEAETAVWNKAWDELSILIQGTLRYGNTENQSLLWKTGKGQGASSTLHNTLYPCLVLRALVLLQPKSTATLIWSRHQPNGNVGALWYKYSITVLMNQLALYRGYFKAGEGKIPKHIHFSFPFNRKDYLLYDFSLWHEECFLKRLCSFTITLFSHWETNTLCMVLLI